MEDIEQYEQKINKQRREYAKKFDITIKHIDEDGLVEIIVCDSVYYMQANELDLLIAVMGRVNQIAFEWGHDTGRKENQ